MKHHLASIIMAALVTLAGTSLAQANTSDPCENLSGDALASCRSQHAGDWVNRYGDRITRKQYMTEMGHRWDYVDSRHHGYLSTEDAQRVYGSELPPAGNPSNIGRNGPNSIKGGS